MLLTVLLGQVSDGDDGQGCQLDDLLLVLVEVLGADDDDDD